MVEGEEVVAQEGDFYGGWKTSEIEGKTKVSRVCRLAITR